MKYESPLKRGTKTKHENGLPTKPFEYWEPHVIAEWTNTLRLSEDYSTVIIAKKIDGEALTIIHKKDYWEKFGFCVPSDILKIEDAISKLAVHVPRIHNASYIFSAPKHCTSLAVITNTINNENDAEKTDLSKRNNNMPNNALFLRTPADFLTFPIAIIAVTLYES